jgi:hypothetical protein
MNNAGAYEATGYGHQAAGRVGLKAQDPRSLQPAACNPQPGDGASRMGGAEVSA